jgi:hypothetical protein
MGQSQLLGVAGAQLVLQPLQKDSHVAALELGVQRGFLQRRTELVVAGPAPMVALHP